MSHVCYVVFLGSLFHCVLLCLLGTLCSRALVTFVTFYVIIVIVIVLIFLIVFVFSCVQRFSVWRCSDKFNSVCCSSNEDCRNVLNSPALPNNKIAKEQVSIAELVGKFLSVLLHWNFLWNFDSLLSEVDLRKMSQKQTQETKQWKPRY